MPLMFAAAWFTETPWPPVIILGVAAALAAGAWLSTQQGKYLVAVGGIAALGVAVVVIERAIVTEAEVVEQRVHDLVEAFRAKDRERTLSFFSATASAERFAVAIAIQTVTIRDDLKITDMNVELLAAGSRATSHFRANATVDAGSRGAERRMPSRWLLTWQKEEGEWRVKSGGVEQLDVVRGTPIEWRRYLGL